MFHFQCPQGLHPSKTPSPDLYMHTGILKHVVVKFMCDNVLTCDKFDAQFGLPSLIPKEHAVCSIEEKRFRNALYPYRYLDFGTPGSTEESFASTGRLFTSRGGKKYGITHLAHEHRGINGTRAKLYQKLDGTGES
jgi:hypothetical protein